MNNLLAKVEKENIAAVIFDLGGVILDIDHRQIMMALQKKLPPSSSLNVPELYSRPEQQLAFARFESGLISSEEYSDHVRQVMQLNREELTMAEFERCWCAILLDIPQKRIDYLCQLKKELCKRGKRLLMLSNINDIHTRVIEERWGKWLPDRFHKLYYSYQMGLRKPDPRIYQELLREENLLPEQTLFFDDTLINVEAAEALGMHAIHWNEQSKLF